ncbi:Hypothetical protein, putative, partial [Bodo saltans]
MASTNHRIYLPFRRDERTSTSSSTASSYSADEGRRQATTTATAAAAAAASSASHRYHNRSDGGAYHDHHDEVSDDDDDEDEDDAHQLSGREETERETEARVAFTSPPRRDLSHNGSRLPSQLNFDMHSAQQAVATAAVLSPHHHQHQQQSVRTDANTQRQFQLLPQQHQQQRTSQYREELTRLIEEQTAHLNRTPSNDDGRSDDEEEDDEDDEDDDNYEDNSGQAFQQQANPMGGARQFQAGASPRQAPPQQQQDAAALQQDELPPQQQQLMDLSGEEYEPTEQEIQEYCEWLGLDMATDKCLVWIAREALRAPLPENWTMCYTDEREVYYFNVRTGESIWDHPMDAYYKSLYKEEKIKLDRKRKKSRSFKGSLPVKPLAEFFSELSDTCGVGAIVLIDDDEGTTTTKGDEDTSVNNSFSQPPPPPWNDVPDALIDPIDFRVFLDPVVLPTSGRTVSRHTIINNTWRDPFTREYCENRRLVPNVDKRSEVDRWLQSMVQAFVQRMKGGTLSGLQRLAAILPFLLDRDEEACVRGQTIVLGWLLRQVEQDKVYQLELKKATEAAETAAAAVARQQQEQQQEQQQAQPPKVSPREGGASHRERGGGGGGCALASSSKRQSVTSSSNSTTGKAAAVASRSGSIVSKSLETLPLAAKSTTTPRSASVVPLCPATPPPSTSSVTTPPQRRRVLLDLFSNLSHEDVEQILLSLMTMSTSASREALLLLATYVPQLMQRGAVFGTFDDDVRFVLRISKKDLSELVQSADEAYARLCRDHEQQQKLQQSGSASLSSQPFPQHQLASPISNRDAAVDSPLTGMRAFPLTTNGGGPSSMHRTSSSGTLHDTTSDLRTRGGRTTQPSTDNIQDDDGIDAPMPIDFLSLLRVHAVSDSEKKLSLRWLLLLHTTPVDVLPEEAQHPFSTDLDLPSVARLVLCSYASKLLPVQQQQQPPSSLSSATSAHLPSTIVRSEFGDSSVYIAMLPRCQGWPQQIHALPDATLRSLMELCAVSNNDAEAQVRMLFDLMLHGSERCMDVVVRHATGIKASVVHVLQQQQGGQHASSSAQQQQRAEDVGNAIASSPADLLAAILIFHDLVSLEEIGIACSAHPTVALKVAYNLTPRLARSQWRPKHFHQTITSFASLVEEHREEAWRVIDRAGLHFFLRELSKKKNTAADVRAKIETLEASERQLEQSMTLARWGKFAKCLEQKRAMELKHVLDTRKNAKLAALKSIANQKPTTTTSSTMLPITTNSASPRGITTTVNTSALKQQPLKSMPTQQQPQQKPSPRTTLPKLSPRSAAVVTMDAPTTTLIELPPTSIEVRCAALVAAANTDAEHASKKQSEIIAQRASLLSQALVMLITVRLKPKQHRSGGATAAAVALQLQQQQQQQFQGSDSPGMGKGSSAAATQFVKSPPATRKAPTEIVMQSSRVGSSRQVTPRQPEFSDSVNSSSSGAPPPPPSAPAALPTLRTLRTPGGGAGLTTPPQQQMMLPLSSRRQMQQSSIISTSSSSVSTEQQQQFQQQHHQRLPSLIATSGGGGIFFLTSDSFFAYRRKISLNW